MHLPGGEMNQNHAHTRWGGDMMYLPGGRGRGDHALTRRGVQPESYNNQEGK